MEFRFEWDDAKAISNRRKHGIVFPLAATVFLDPLMVSIPDDDHSTPQEERWLTLGQARNGMLLVVAHTCREIDMWETAVRIISARSATRHERRQYEESHETGV